jgi:hypothetical protein
VVGLAVTGWDRAVDNFVQYLPDKVRHWLVALTPGPHDKVAGAVLPRLGSSEVVVLAELGPRGIRDLVGDNVQRPDVGFLEFTVGTAQQWSLDHLRAMAGFDRWPRERMRRCVDVWDANFAVLFAEDPVELADRCRSAWLEVSAHPQLGYGNPEPALRLDCAGVSWTAYTGFEEHDHILPSGKVSCRPRSVDGELDLDGWLVGTIPFGLKYGRIRPGELILGFAAGRVTHITGSRTELIRDLENTLHRVPGLQSVGELGIGQSRAVVEAAALHLMGCQWHDRHVGIHLGLGAELPESDGFGRGATAHHLDVVLATGSLSGGPYVLEHW